jgi:hypothetical protein
LLRCHFFLPFLYLDWYLDRYLDWYLGRRSVDPHRGRHEIFNHTDRQQSVVRMRHYSRVIAEEGVDQFALARVQEWDRELVKVAKRPEQINALPERKVNADQSLPCLKQQEAGLEPIQKHGTPPGPDPRYAYWMPQSRIVTQR